MFDVVILANGQSIRFGENKLLAKINEELLILKTIKCFFDLEGLQQIIVVGNEQINKQLQKFELPNLVFTVGGPTRSLSVARGLEMVTAPNVLIHDGARPFASKKLITDVYKNLKAFDVVVPIQKVVNCLKK
ncbi:2-C-methyl-D-erythritol 4-phosphate cytidylyltransferase [Spiroplasma clarkii]|nr:2-C-methyl-D-erythritol 4-phosphate cytidylyltransferase [Spiroplasma clarkii]